MPRIEPVEREQLAEYEPVLQMVEQSMGFVPNSMLTMARKPGLLQAFAGLGAVVLGPQTSIGEELGALIAFVCSRSAGCAYCMAHASHTAIERQGVSRDKLEAIWDFERSPLFTEAERSALVVAQAAGQIPNAVSDADFNDLKRHFTDEQILDIVSIISVFGFLNRWNETLATGLESAPLKLANEILADHGWVAGKHAPKANPDG